MSIPQMRHPPENGSIVPITEGPSIGGSSNLSPIGGKLNPAIEGITAEKSANLRGSDQTANLRNDMPDPGEVPVLDWIDKTLIDADPLYQRPLDKARVDTILQAFSWRSFGAIVVVPQADGRYHTPDGQHRLAAAKLHPLVSVVPAIIVKADDVPAEAGIFVDINRNRKNVSALELFFAQLAAGDEHALAVLNACQQAGIRIPKNPGDYKPNDSIAVAAIGALITKNGCDGATEMLKVVAAGRLVPITGAHIKAVEHIMTASEFKDVAPDDLAALLRRDRDMHESEARRFAATHKVAAWKGMANVWFQKCRKRRAPASTEKVIESHPKADKKAGTTASVSAKIAPTEPTKFRTIIPHTAPTQRNVTAAAMGDPPPGRSALDARRAG